MILRQIRLVERASTLVSEKVAYVTSQTGVQTVTNSQERRKRADVNYEHKLQSKGKKAKFNNYITLEDNILAKLVREQSPKSTAIVKSIPCRAGKLPPSTTPNINLTPPPKKKQYFSYLTTSI